MDYRDLLENRTKECALLVEAIDNSNREEMDKHKKNIDNIDDQLSKIFHLH